MTPGRTSPFHTRIPQARASLFVALSTDNITQLDEFLNAYDSWRTTVQKAYSMAQMTEESAEFDGCQFMYYFMYYAPERERIAWPGTGSPENMAGVKWLIRRMVSNASRTFFEEGPARMR